MDLKQLKQFMAVADYGSITKAAEAIHLSQPAVTLGIRSLEKDLGVPLFDRLPRGMQLTLYGEALHRHAQAISTLMEDAAEEIEHLQNRPSKEVRVGAGPIWWRKILPDVLTRLSQRRKDVEFVIRGGFDNQLFNQLRRGEVDFVLSEFATDGSLDDLQTEMMFQSQYKIICADTHPLAGIGSVSLKETLRYRWIMADQADYAQIRLAGLFKTRNLPLPSVGLRSSSLEFIYNALGGSDFLSFVVGPTNALLDSRSLVALDVAAQLPVLETGVVRRKNDWISPVAEELISEIVGGVERQSKP